MFRCDGDVMKNLVLGGLEDLNTPRERRASASGTAVNLFVQSRSDTSPLNGPQLQLQSTTVWLRLCPPCRLSIEMDGWMDRATALHHTVQSR